ncbi:MAG: hypothetical protein ACRENG_03310 [bacterium]
MITDHIVANDIAIEEIMWLAMQGGAFELLAEEPELYSPEDGKPVQWPQSLLSSKSPIADNRQIPADTAKQV